jgi:hypothetical protein
VNLGWAVTNQVKRTLLAAGWEPGAPANWVPLREAIVSVGGEGNVALYELEENAIEAARWLGGFVVNFSAEITQFKAREDCARIPFPMVL